jgi:hypothetical protein
MSEEGRIVVADLNINLNIINILTVNVLMGNLVLMSNHICISSRFPLHNQYRQYLPFRKLVLVLKGRYHIQ